MRVAYVCADPGVPVFGSKGCSVHVQEIVRAMKLRGVRVDLFAAHLGGRPPADLEDIRVHELPIFSGGGAAGREQACLNANRDLWDILQGNGPFDLVYERYSLWSYAGMEYAHRAGTPGLLEVNAPLIEEQKRHRVLHDEEAARRVERQALSRARVILAVSEEMAGYLRKIPEAADRVHWLPNGVNPSRFMGSRNRRVSGLEKQFTVGFLGSLKPWHGLNLLVESFHKLKAGRKDVHLLVVGDGPERPSLEAGLRNRGLADSSTLTGTVPPSDVPRWLDRMDVGVAPYERIPDFYFSPLKVLEYMAAGVAVVASAIGQLHQIIDHEESGILVEPGNARELARELDRLRCDPALRKRLGANARDRVIKAYTWDSVVGRAFLLAGFSDPGSDEKTREVA